MAGIRLMLFFRKHPLDSRTTDCASRTECHQAARLLGCVALAVAAGLALQSTALAQSGDSSGTHVVALGETLSELAERYQTTTEVLARINGLSSPDRIQIGQTLVVETASAAPAGSAPAGPTVHVVEAGEALLTIADRYGVSVESVATINGLADPDRIFVGQKLKIPQTAPHDTAAEPSLGSDGARSVRGGTSLSVPYRSQFTGSPYEESDCGPATLGMLLSFYGKDASTASLRQWVMESTRYWGYDGGSDWKSLVYASKKAGLQPDGLYNPSGGYRKWTVDDLLAQIKAGDPVMLLVRFRTLPGHTGSSWWGDHYIVVFGVTADGQFIYHDSAFQGQIAGAYRTVSRENLQRAWSTTSVGIQYSGMVLRK